MIAHCTFKFEGQVQLAISVSLHSLYWLLIGSLKAYVKSLGDSQKWLYNDQGFRSKFSHMIYGRPQKVQPKFAL